jgi:hypothetical protein
MRIGNIKAVEIEFMDLSFFEHRTGLQQMPAPKPPLITIQAELLELEVEFFNDTSRFKKWLRKHINRIKLKRPRAKIKWTRQWRKDV